MSGAELPIAGLACRSCSKACGNITAHCGNLQTLSLERRLLKRVCAKVQTQLLEALEAVDESLKSHAEEYLETPDENLLKLKGDISAWKEMPNGPDFSGMFGSLVDTLENVVYARNAERGGCCSSVADVFLAASKEKAVKSLKEDLEKSWTEFRERLTEANIEDFGSIKADLKGFPNDEARRFWKVCSRNAKEEDVESLLSKYQQHYEALTAAEIDTVKAKLSEEGWVSCSKFGTVATELGFPFNKDAVHKDELYRQYGEYHSLLYMAPQDVLYGESNASVLICLACMIDVCICCANAHTDLLAFPLKAILEGLGVSSVYVITQRTRCLLEESNKRIQAVKKCRVFVPFVDDKHFLQSEDCMSELKLALTSTSREQLAVFLTSSTTFVESAQQFTCQDAFERWHSWDHKQLLDTAAGLLAKSSSSFRVLEQETFQMVAVAEAILSILGQPIEMRRLTQYTQRYPKSLWNLVYTPIHCKLQRNDSKSAHLREEQYVRVKQTLLGKLGPERIAGFKGIGGSGKTWLAIRLGNELVELHHDVFPDGVYFESFGENPATMKETLRKFWLDLGGDEAVCDDIDITEVGMGELFSKLLHTRNPRALLILDDIWDKRVLDIFLEVVKSCSNIKLLVTLRRALLDPGPQHCILSISSNMEEDDAVALIKSHARALIKTNPAFQGDNDELMRRIAELAGFHAKTLSIIVSQAHHSSSWGSFVEQLESQFHDTGGNELDLVQTAVWLTYESGFENHGESKKMFFQLGVLVEYTRFTEADLRILWEVDTAEWWLRKFVSCSIIEVDTNDKEKFYTHHLVRQCAREKAINFSRLESRFQSKLSHCVLEEKQKVTEYMARSVHMHLPGSVEAEEIRKALVNSQDGKYEDAWRQNRFFVLQAVQSESWVSCLNDASPDLFADQSFIERALSFHDSFGWVTFTRDLSCAFLIEKNSIFG